MKLDPRILLPAALLAGALALPAGASATPPTTYSCPDHYVLLPLGAVFMDRDKNNDGQVCVKEEDMNLILKDDNCNPNCNQSDVLPGLDPSTLPSDAVVDDTITF